MDCDRASGAEVWPWAPLLGQEKVAQEAVTPLVQPTQHPSPQGGPAGGDGGVWVSGFGAQRQPCGAEHEPQASVALPWGTPSAIQSRRLRSSTPAKTLFHATEVTVGGRGAAGSTGAPRQGLGMQGTPAGTKAHSTEAQGPAPGLPLSHLPQPPPRALEGFAMNSPGAILLILLFGNPHLLERVQGGQNGAANPRGVQPLLGC